MKKQTNVGSTRRNRALHTARSIARGYALPLELTCKVTGKIVRYTDPKYIGKRIQQAGSLRRLMNSFISRAGKSKLAHAA